LASWVISAILFFSEMAPGTKALLIFIDTIIVSDIFLNYTICIHRCMSGSFKDTL